MNNVLSISSLDYLKSTIPIYVQDEMDKMAEELLKLEKSKRILKILEKLNELQELSVLLNQKLKTQEGFMLFPKLLSDQFIIEFREITKCKERKNERNYFQSWSYANLDLIEIYTLQTFLRVLCIATHFECKKYFDTSLTNFKKKYQQDLSKVFLLLKTKENEFKLSPDFFFNEIFENCNSKNVQLCAFIQKFSQDYGLKFCLSTIEKNQEKLREVKKNGFKQFKQEKQKQESQKESQKESVQLSMQISNNETSSQVFQQGRQSRHLIQNQRQSNNLSLDNNKSETNLQKINRPSFCSRTIKEGINNKYKRDNENRQQMQQFQNQNNNIHQKIFFQEVTQKLQRVKKQQVASWNSEFLAPETPEVYSD